MQQQLNEMKLNPEIAESTKHKVIEDDLEDGLVQIQDVQQKLLDSNGGNNKNKNPLVLEFNFCNIYFYFRQ